MLHKEGPHLDGTRPPFAGVTQTTEAQPQPACMQLNTQDQWTCSQTGRQVPTSFFTARSHDQSAWLQFFIVVRRFALLDEIIFLVFER